jgi:hypothetical protein
MALSAETEAVIDIDADAAVAAVNKITATAEQVT